jgi:hypothetical protein
MCRPKGLGQVFVITPIKVFNFDVSIHDLKSKMERRFRTNELLATVSRAKTRHKNRLSLRE